MEHTANVLAQYIDNDEDGSPDEAIVLSFLVDNNFVVPVWSESDRDPFFEGLRGELLRRQLRDDSEHVLRVGYRRNRKGGTWDTNPEEVWHVVSVGWYNSYPTDFGDSRGSSQLTAAMNLARRAI